MYKLLIVDDEESIRMGIAHGINWNQWGFTVSGTCSDGMEAIAEIEREKPDIVLSDIRMPKMDGVELMQILNKRYPEIKIVILSGYKDFEYLNMSIKNDVAEYLLKPTDLDEFELLFKKLKGKLDEEHEREIERLKLKAENELTKMYISEKSLNLLLNECAQEEEQELLKKQIEEYYGVYLKRYVLIICKVDGETRMNKEKLYRRKKNIVEYCNKAEIGMEHKFYLYHEKEIIGISSVIETGINLTEMMSGLKELQRKIRNNLGISISCGISSISSGTEELVEAYREAERSVNQKIYFGTETIFSFDQFSNGKWDFVEVAFDNENIKKYILEDNKKELKESIHKTAAILKNQPIERYSYFDDLCLELFYFLSRIGKTYGLSLENIIIEDGIQKEDFSSAEMIDEKEKLMYKIAEILLERIKKTIQKKKGGSHTAFLIKEYIDSEYMNNSISLDYIAEKVGKNPAYISKLFKSEMECNFSEYVTKKRLEKSKELLRDPALKIYQISELVGYADVSNYIKIFRKKYGVSPSEYRMYH